MIALPLPFLTFVLAVVAGVLVSRQDFGAAQARFFFVAFFVVIAAASLLVGLRFGYGYDRLMTVQRALPLFIGPCLYLGFANLATSEDNTRRLATLHLGAALALAMLPAFLPDAAFGADWLIGASYLCYAILLLGVWRRGPNHLIRARLETAGQFTRWAACGSGFLLVILVFDTVIAISFARDQGGAAIALISYGATLMTALLLLVIFTLATQRVSRRIPAMADPAPTRDTQAIVDAAQTLGKRWLRTVRVSA